MLKNYLPFLTLSVKQFLTATVYRSQLVQKLACPAEVILQMDAMGRFLKPATGNVLPLFLY